MLAICEDCAKKYNIDESRIKGERARFSCYECGHIIVVEKPKTVQSKPEPEPEPKSEPVQMSDEDAMAYIAGLDAPEQQGGSTGSEVKKGSSGSMTTVLVLIAVLVGCGVLAYMYLQ